MNELFQLKSAPPVSANPVAKLYGAGPQEETCKHCKFLFRHKNKYLKCKFRTFTRGPGSDHKAGWPACAKFERVSR